MPNIPKTSAENAFLQKIDQYDTEIMNRMGKVINTYHGTSDIVPEEFKNLTDALVALRNGKSSVNEMFDMDNLDDFQDKLDQAIKAVKKYNNSNDGILRKFFQMIGIVRQAPCEDTAKELEDRLLLLKENIDALKLSQSLRIQENGPANTRDNARTNTNAASRQMNPTASMGQPSAYRANPTARKPSTVYQRDVNIASNVSERTVRVTNAPRGFDPSTLQVQSAHSFAIGAEASAENHVASNVQAQASGQRQVQNGASVGAASTGSISIAVNARETLSDPNKSEADRNIVYYKSRKEEYLDLAKYLNLIDNLTEYGRIKDGAKDLNSNDIKKLSALYERMKPFYEETSEEMRYMKHRMDEVKNISKVQETSKATFQNQKSDLDIQVEKDKKGKETVSTTIMLQNTSQQRTQDTPNGCWSVCLSTLLGQKGVQLDQKAIRAYRPNGDYGTKDDMINSNWDREGNRIDLFRDLAMELVPDTAMNGAEYLGFYGRNDGKEVKLTKELRKEAKEAAKKALDTVIKKSILKDKSALGIVAGNHYRTICGVKLDKNASVQLIYYFDPLKDGIQKMNLDELANKCAYEDEKNKTLRYRFNVEWLHSLTNEKGELAPGAELDAAMKGKWSYDKDGNLQRDTENNAPVVNGENSVDYQYKGVENLSVTTYFPKMLYRYEKIQVKSAQNEAEKDASESKKKEVESSDSKKATNLNQEGEEKAFNYTPEQREQPEQLEKEAAELHKDNTAKQDNPDLKVTTEKTKEEPKKEEAKKDKTKTEETKETSKKDELTNKEKPKEETKETSNSEVTKPEKTNEKSNSNATKQELKKEKTQTTKLPKNEKKTEEIQNLNVKSKGKELTNTSNTVQKRAVSSNKFKNNITLEAQINKLIPKEQREQSIQYIYDGIRKTKKRNEERALKIDSRQKTPKKTPSKERNMGGPVK